MTIIDSADLDLEGLLKREYDRCNATGVREYMFFAAISDSNVLLYVLRTMEGALAVLNLGRIENVMAPAAVHAAVERVLPHVPVGRGQGGEVEILVKFNISPDSEAFPEVILDTLGPLGLITLNRPKALNALSLPMIRAIYPQMNAWAEDPAIRAVVIRGAGDKAFCAGGDIRAVYDYGLARRRGEAPAGSPPDFFGEEYVLNHRIHRFPKPYLALIDGISMGGGVGLSVHGSHRVVTERTVFAMPETGIGLFPDVGGGWFLPRCPGELGTYLALTGHRCRAADCRAIGYGTHYVPAAKLEAVIDALAAATWQGDADAVVDAVLAQHAEDPGPAPLAERRTAIDRCFGHDSIEAIMAALQHEGGSWAHETIATLRRMSPTSLKLTLRQIRLGAGMDYEDVVTMEYRMARACMEGYDFYEGIRAQIIDKDRNPQWRPATLAELTESDLARYFAPLGERDLVLKQGRDGSDASGINRSPAGSGPFPPA